MKSGLLCVEMLGKVVRWVGNWMCAGVLVYTVGNVLEEHLML